MTTGIYEMISSGWGVYIPKHFADTYYAEAWHIPPEKMSIVAEGPDHDWYWETWDDICRDAYYIDKQGHKWVLWHSCGLYAVCDELLDDAERKLLRLEE